MAILGSGAITTSTPLGASQKQVHAKILENDSSRLKHSTLTKAALSQVEQNKDFTPVKQIRPSRSDVSIVTVGDRQYYRREDTDKGLIDKEAKILEFYSIFA